MNKGKLGTVKQTLLKDIGVVWNFLSHQWKNHCNLLVKYNDREDHCDVKQSHKEEGENLGK